MKVLLFDVDGTLIRAGGAGRKALNRAIGTLYGSGKDCGEINLSGKTDLCNFAEAIRHATGRKPKSAEIECVHKEYLRVLPRCVQVALRAKKYHLAPGIKKLLKRLSREKNVLLGLGTGNMEHGARIKLEPSGLSAFFLFGGYGSDSFHRPVLLKKAVQRAKKLLNGRKIKAEEVYVIGDTALDVEAGRKAGFKTIAVGTGFAEWQDLVRSKPDHLARDFREIDQWFKWLKLDRAVS